MKYWLCLLLFISFITVTAQNVGIGTATPAARLHVTDSAVLFTGPSVMPFTTNFAPPASGAGTRFMWYPQKGALRSGYVLAANWDKDSIGFFSVSMGFNTKATGPGAVCFGSEAVASGSAAVSLGNNTVASGNISVALGSFSRADGYSSTAMGSYSVSSGEYSTAFGYTAKASGFMSVAAGGNTTASGYESTAMGFGTLAFGVNSTAFGFATIASGQYSTSMGAYTKASGITSMAVGSYNIARSNNSLVAGTFNDTSLTNSLFEIGNGTADNARRNAFTVLSNGNTGIGISNPANPLSFPPTLTKKVSFYPGATGDVGISVSGNDLRLYSDNVNARVSFGYDDYATGFTSRAYVTASGTTGLVVQGNMTVNGTNYNSDARFKQHIQPLKGALEKINALQGVQYEMRTKEFPERNFQSGTEIGLIAQDVEQVIPELVRTDTDGYKSVDYAKLVPVLIEGMKAQQKQIEALQEEVRKLKKQK